MADEAKATPAAPASRSLPFLALVAFALPGFLALLVGHGVGRFSFTPMIPAMVGAGWTSGAEAAYLGATNLGGYLLGGLLALPLARAWGTGMTIRTALAATVAATLLCALNPGFWGLVPLRLLTGITGGVLIILAAPAVLAATPASARGRVGGLMFTGIGSGIALSGTLVPWLADFGVVVAWIGISAVGLIALLAGWRFWQAGGALVPLDTGANIGAGLQAGQIAAAPASDRLRLTGGWAMGLLAFAYIADAIGFVPHSVFIADYVARGLGLGLGLGGWQWIAFGCGAMAGPILLGALADRIGFRPTLALAVSAKALGVASPLLTESLALMAVGSAIVGAVTPGIAMLTSGAALEIVGVAAYRQTWRTLTLLFGIFQAAGAYGLSYLFAATGDYRALFALGTAAMTAGALALIALALFGRTVRAAAAP